MRLLLPFVSLVLLALLTGAPQARQAPAASAPSATRSLAERLGYTATDRLLIVNADDVGMSHAANAATIAGMERGVISSGSIMVPCPWFEEIAAYARATPAADFGLHLTHTSEWKVYKWGPVAGRSVVPGLVTPQGYLWPDVQSVYAHATPKEALQEARAQIRKALDAGIDVTHLDSHMGALQYDMRFHQVYRQLAQEFDLPIRMGNQDVLTQMGGGHLRGELDAKTTYGLGICQFMAGQRDAGLANIEAALEASPGVLPAWPLGRLLDTLTSIRETLAATRAAPGPDPVVLSLDFAIGLALVQCQRDPGSLFVDVIRGLRPMDRLTAPDAPSEDAVRRMVAPQPVWHSMDLGTTFVEGRRKPARILAGELLRLDLGDLQGKTVLDIGAWDGFFSFESERRGAARVVALEYHSWVLDLDLASRYVSEQRTQGQGTPDLYAAPASVRDEERLPGRRVFDLAHRLLGSAVEPVCRDFREVVPEELGTFDVTLFLGVLYHLTDPFGALAKIAALTRERAVIETLGIHDPGATTRPMWEFYKDDRVNQDPTTWWAPNECALRDMLEVVGFRRVVIKSGVDTLGLSAVDKPGTLRLIAHAWK